MDVSRVGYSYPLSRAIKLHLKNVIPLAVMYFLILSTKFLALHFLRAENDEVIAAIGLASNVSWVCFQGVFTALNIGMLSRLSQAYGAKDYRLLGLYFHRGIINDMLLSIPLACLIIFSEDLLNLIGIQDSITIYVRKYLVLILPGLYFSTIANAISAYLNSADIFITPSIFQAVSAIAFGGSCYLLIGKWQMGLSGAAYSFNIMNALNLIFCVLYITIWKPVPGTLFCFNQNSFQNLWDLFKHQCMVGSMILAKWIFSVILALLVGMMTTVELTAWVAVYGNIIVSYMVPIGLMDTTLAFVGNCMGEGKFHKAQTLLKAGVIINLVYIILVEVVYLLFGRQILGFYLTDPDAIDIGVKIFHLFAFVWPADSFQMVLGAGLRAIGKEKSGTATMLTGIYLIAIPLGYLLAFTYGLRVLGLVIGQIVGYNFVLFIYVYITRRVDWKSLAEKIYMKLEKDKAQTGELSEFNIEDHMKNSKLDDGLLVRD